jgi:hypothetical protein
MSFSRWQKLIAACGVDAAQAQGGFIHGGVILPGLADPANLPEWAGAEPPVGCGGGRTRP